MDKALILLAVYLVAWFTVTSICWYRCRGLRSLIIAPLFLGVRLSKGLNPRPIGYRKTLVLDILWLLLLLASLVGFYYITGVTLWLRYFKGVEAAAFVPIIPGVTLSFKLFLDLMPAIFIAVAVHEAMHALTAIINGVPVKGFGVGLIIGIIPIAFVELDDSKLNRARRVSRIGVYSAGVAGNLLLALLLTLLLLTPKAVVVVGVEKGSPAEQAGLQPYSIILEVNGVKVRSIDDLRRAIEGSTHATILVSHDSSSYYLKLTRSSPKARYGLLIAEVPTTFLPLGVERALELATFVILTRLVNIALAFINAAPLFITDGAKVFSELSPKLANVASLATIIVFLLTMSLQRIG